MPSYKGQEKGIREPISLRVGLDIPGFVGEQRHLDPSTIAIGAFQHAINARIYDGILISRGGQSKVITTPIAYDWDSLYDAGGGGPDAGLSLYYVGPATSYSGVGATPNVLAKYNIDAGQTINGGSPAANQSITGYFYAWTLTGYLSSYDLSIAFVTNNPTVTTLTFTESGGTFPTDTPSFTAVLTNPHNWSMQGLWGGPLTNLLGLTATVLTVPGSDIYSWAGSVTATRDFGFTP